MRRAAACLILMAVQGCGPQVGEEPLDFSDPQTIAVHGLSKNRGVSECIASERDRSFNAGCRDDYYTNIASASDLTCDEDVECRKGSEGHGCEGEKGRAI
jgi:hypothetical protein